MNYITLYKALWISILLLFLPLAMLSNNAQATAINKPQDINTIKNKAHEFLSTQTVGIPGKVNISVGSIDKYTKLEECIALEAFMPAGSRPWGKTTVGIRCAAPSVWTLYVQAKVSVISEYLVAARPLAQGQVVSSDDFILQQGDLSTLPPSIITNPSEVIGRTITSSITAGTAIRQDLLRSPMVISLGQTVRIISMGKGFSVSSEALALANANDGQVVKAKTANGIVVSGIARQGGNVMVSY